ncbi:MAG: beta-phosphoglucomutase [Ktedonobacteraceae bacterium]
MVQKVGAVQAVIWDLDGVVIDSEEDHKKAWQRLARETGKEFSDAQFATTFGWRNDAIIPTVWGAVSAEELQELADRKEIYYRDYVRNTAAFLPGAQELMHGLHNAGYPQALGSSAPLANIELVKEVLELGRYINAFVSGETVLHGKPAPDIFLKAAKELDTEPAHCLVIEDAIAGIAAARAGGMYSIAVAYGRVLPGLQVATLVVKDLAEVNVERIQHIA